MTKSQSPFSVRFSERHSNSSMEMVGGRDFRLDESGMADFFFATPSARQTDFLRIAMSVYVIDRLVRRKKRSNDYRWSRSLQAEIGVLDADFWNSTEVRQALTDCVEFVSGDSWDFSFNADSTPIRTGAVLPFRFDTPLVCLYSGGLDSAAGLSSRIADSPDLPVVPVTVWHQPLQKKLLLRKQYPLIASRLGVKVTPLIMKAAMVWSSMPWLSELRRKEERSQRSRSFLFAAAGATAAVMSGASTVEVYESGVGAINLPLMAGMAGSKATKSCHPEFFRRMSLLSSLVANRAVRFDLPFFDTTKGHVVRRLADLGLETLARSTASCVHFPLRESAHKQCGVCPACLFRRLSMFAGGIGEASNTYKYDLFGSTERANRVPVKRLAYLKAVLMQVVQLGTLEHGSAVPDRIRRHLIGTGIVRHGEPLEPILAVLRQYRHEWLELAALGERQGWSWTKLLGPQGAARQEEVSNASA